MHFRPLYIDSVWMNQKDPLDKHRKIAESFLSQLPPEKIEELNQKESQRVKEAHEKFVRAVKNGECNICEEQINSFIIAKPCLHWLIRPAGFEKKHFPLVYGKFNYIRMQSYLRWIANIELFVGNINDLEEEKNPDKVIEFTIKHRNLEWSFSCSETDLKGHESASHADAQIPHYHFQMRIDSRSFIDYSDFHIPFVDTDLGYLALMLGKVKGATYFHGPGMGMQDALEKGEAGATLNSLVKTEDESKSVFRISTFIQAEDGKLISGDDLAELFKRSKETGDPVAKLVGELKNIKNQTTIISPGPIVPEQAGRKKGNKERKP